MFTTTMEAKSAGGGKMPAEKAERYGKKAGKKQLSAPSPAEKLEDARRKLNGLKAAEGAKAVEVVGADSSVVIESPMSPEVTIDLYLGNGVSSAQISGSSVSVKSVSSSSSNSSRASCSTKRNLPSTSGSRHLSVSTLSTSKTSKFSSSNSLTSTQKRAPASNRNSSSSSKTEEKEDLEEEKKKEMPENIQATMKGDTSSKPSASTYRQLPASKSNSSTSTAKEKTKEELELERKKTGIFRKITSAVMGRK